MHDMTFPLASPFEEFYKQQEQQQQSTASMKSNLGKRSRDESEGTFAWNPTEHKKIRMDYDTIYSNTLHLLRKNANQQFNIQDSSDIDYSKVQVYSDGSPCSRCINYTSDQGICESCSTRVCLDCMFKCEVCSQICCMSCQLTKYYGNYGETIHCTDCCMSRFKEGKIYQRSTDHTVTITLQGAKETHELVNSHKRILFVPDSGDAIQFIEDKNWVADSSCTVGYDPGNTGYGVDEFVTLMTRKSVRRLNEEQMAKETLSEYKSESNLEFEWPAKDYQFIHSYIFGEDKPCEKNEIEFSGSLKDYTNIPGTYTKKLDQAVSGEDYNTEITVITIKEDCSAIYSWKKEQQRGDSLPCLSSEDKNGTLVSGTHSTKCNVKVSISSGNSPLFEIESPPTLKLSFKWNSGFSRGIDISTYTKT